MRADDIAEDILVSLLAVNRWPVDRVFPLVERFRAAGLLDFTAVSRLRPEEIAELLANAGYNRGQYLNVLLAGRISSLANTLTQSEIDRLKRCVSEGRVNEVNSTLQNIKGVGPIVLETFWNLQR